MKLKYVLKLCYNIFRVIINPQNIKSTLRAGEILSKTGLMGTSVKCIKDQSGGKAFFNSKRVHLTSDLLVIAQCPVGSLGHTYYQFLNDNKFSPLPPTKGLIDSDEQYLHANVQNTHDLFHVLTGFDASIAGELGLQAFMAKQFSWPFAMIALGVGFLITLFREPQNQTKVFEQIATGWNLGAQAKSLITVDWNSYIHKPLIEVQREFRLC